MFLQKNKEIPRCHSCSGTGVFLFLRCFVFLSLFPLVSFLHPVLPGRQIRFIRNLCCFIPWSVSELVYDSHVFRFPAAPGRKIAKKE